MGGVALVAACTPEPLRPTYQFDAAYRGGAATPAALRSDFDAHARQICGTRAEILERHFFGDDGPRYVRIRFACP
jgi:hypothetical protein